MELDKYDIPPETIWDLFNISMSIWCLSRHDLHNNLSMAHFELIQDDIKSLRTTLPTNGDTVALLDRLDHYAEQGLRRLHSYVNLLERMLGYFKVTEPNNFFIASPARVLAFLSELHPDAQLTLTAESPQALTILYPENILLAIMAELIRNALKYAESPPTLLIDWKVLGSSFHCDVHDSGSGFSKLLSHHKYLPLDALELFSGTGLSMLDRTLVRSKGLLLFSRSPLLGGALVHFQFPVIAFDLGTSNEERRGDEQ